METLEQLVETWTQCKKAEQMSVETRRKIEDRISEMLEINPNKEETVNLGVSGYKVKIVSRLSRKVDSDLLQEVAAEHGMEALLSSMFRWKADVDVKSWKSATPEVQNVLSKAITTTAGRPSFSVTIEE
jgi:hypothetical protein